MTRGKNWHKHYRQLDTKRLDRRWHDFQDLLRKIETSWYYPYLPKQVRNLLQLADDLRYEAGAHGHHNFLRYKVAILLSEIKTYKQNAVKAKEIKEKYNQLRRERSTNAQNKKS